jgi:hypothetical protein
MLVKLRLLVEWQALQEIDAVWPTIREPYDEGIPDGDGICDDAIISLWADAERLSGNSPPTGRLYPAREV